MKLLLFQKNRDNNALAVRATLANVKLEGAKQRPVGGEGGLLRLVRHQVARGASKGGKEG
jgi:hypothetical protein